MDPLLRRGIHRLHDGDWVYLEECSEKGSLDCGGSPDGLDIGWDGFVVVGLDEGNGSVQYWQTEEEECGGLRCMVAAAS